MLFSTKGLSYSLYYSGSNKTSQAVNGFIVMKKSFYYILGVEPHNEQICKSRIKDKYNSITHLNRCALQK